MADLKISQLTAGSAGEAADLIPVARTGANRSLLLSDIWGVTAPILGSSGLGPAITAGTATTNVAALSITQTWNNAAAATGVKIAITDTTSSASSLPFQVLGGASATTNLLSVSKAGIVAASGITLDQGASPIGLLIGSGGIGGNWSDFGSTIGLRGNTVIAWAADANNASTGKNTGLSVVSAGLIGVGTGAAGSIAGGIQLASIGLSSGHIADSATAPSIASGFGTSPSVVANNGTASFTVDVGTGGTASSGVITMPAATNGWICSVTPAGAPQAAAVTYAVATSTTSITLTNYTLTTGAALAWTAGTVLNVIARGY